MGEIIKHLNGLRAAAYAAAQFHASAHILETGQCLSGLCRADTDMRGGGHGGQGIHLVVHASQTPVHMRCCLALEQHFKIMWLALSLPFATGPKTSDRAPVAHGQHTLQTVLFSIHHQTAAARHGAHQMVKLALNRC